MLKKISIIIITIIIYLFICNHIYKNTPYKIKPIINNYITDKEESPIGKIIIKKIAINNNLYNINSKHNNIEENITILEDSIMPDKTNSIMYIAAHSGDGKIAYFNDLDKLKINDEITIIYKNKKYIYSVKNIWEENKNGYIHINRENEKQLILTTCSKTKKNKQLVINSTLKEVY